MIKQLLRLFRRLFKRDKSEEFIIFYNDDGKSSEISFTQSDRDLPVTSNGSNITVSFDKSTGKLFRE